MSQEPDAERDKLKAEITARLQLEQEIKNALVQPTAKPSRGWWEFINSGLGILLITTLLSSFLVPLYQKHQQDEGWRRQMRADNAKYHLGMMRQCLDEFSNAGTFTSRAYEQNRPALHTFQLGEAEFRTVRDSLVQLQEKRFVQNAKVRALLVQFPDRSSIEPLLFAYNGLATSYMRKIETFIYTVHAQSLQSLKKENRGGGIDLASTAEELSKPNDMYKAFDSCAAEIFQQIAHEEKRYEEASF